MPVGLSFSLRADAVLPLHDVRAQVEAALGVPLAGGEFGRVPALVGQVLGMRMGLLEWRGLGGATTYQLHGEPAWPGRRPPEWEEIDIGPAVLELLARAGATGWRVPSREELRAEAQYDYDEI